MDKIVVNPTFYNICVERGVIKSNFLINEPLPTNAAEKYLKDCLERSDKNLILNIMLKRKLESFLVQQFGSIEAENIKREIGYYALEEQYGPITK